MERDEQGRLLKGHSGLKPKGATGLITAEIRERLTDFIAGKLDSLPDLYESLKPADRMRLMVAMMQMVLPKNPPPEQKDIHITWEDPVEPEPQKIVFEIIDPTTKEVARTGEVTHRLMLPDNG
jgi:hypothetical protein